MQIVDESDQPGAYLISCGKCLRSHEIHGTPAKLEQALLAEGWLEESGKMICPNCPAPRELPNYNKTKEIARRARRAAHNASLFEQYPVEKWLGEWYSANGGLA